MISRLRNSFDYWFTRYLLLRRGPDPRKISVAIPTYNSAEYFEETLDSVLGDPRIEQIVVSDDASTIEHYSEVKNHVNRRISEHPFVELHRQPINVGAFKNKFLAVQLCRSSYTILLDADNSLGHSYIDKLFSLISWKERVIYCPDFARPRFNFRQFSGLEVTLNSAKALLADKDNILADGETGPWPRWRSIQTLLSTGNYFVPTKLYCECIRPFCDLSGLTACTIAAVYIWLNCGNSLEVVRGLEYFHRIHDASISTLRADENKQLARRLCDMLIEERGLDDFSEKSLGIG